MTIIFTCRFHGLSWRSCVVTPPADDVDDNAEFAADEIRLLGTYDGRLRDDINDAKIIHTN